jgi:hypothetical protein
MSAATNPSDFELKMRMFGRRAPAAAAPATAAPAVATSVAATGSPNADPAPANGMQGLTTGGLDFMGQ